MMPAGQFVEFSSRKKAEDLRAKVDAELGYPRAGARVSAGGYAAGSPVHVTEHYSGIIDHPTKAGTCAVFVDAVVDAALDGLVFKGDPDALTAPEAKALDPTWERDGGK